MNQAMVRRAYAVVSSPANASATATGLPNWVIAAAAAWSGASRVAMRSSVACSRPSRSSVKIASRRRRGPCSCAARSERYAASASFGRGPALVAERDLPGRGEVVGAAAASANGLPVTSDQPGAFQPVQRRVDRARGEIEGAVAAGAQRLDDGVSMLRTRLEDGEQQRVEMALEQFRSHWQHSRRLLAILAFRPALIV